MLAQMVSDAHRSRSSHTTTRKEVIDLLSRAVRDGLVRVDQLKGKMQDEVQARLNETP